MTRLLIPSDLHAACAKAVVATATEAMEGPFVLPFDLTVTLRGSVKRGAEFVQAFPGTLTTLDLVVAACAMSGAVRPVFEKIATDPLAVRNFVHSMSVDRTIEAEALVQKMRWATERVVMGKRSYTIDAAEVR